MKYSVHKKYALLDMVCNAICTTGCMGGLEHYSPGSYTYTPISEIVYYTNTVKSQTQNILLCNNALQLGLLLHTTKKSLIKKTAPF